MNLPSLQFAAVYKNKPNVRDSGMIEATTSWGQTLWLTGTDKAAFKDDFRKFREDKLDETQIAALQQRVDDVASKAE